MFRHIFSASALIALSACASVDYQQLQPGRFSGSLIVMWVGEGGTTGDGAFLFVPDPENPLTFYRRDKGKRGAVVRPGMMYTDGGSIPKIGQLFRGFSPWGYAPAYMVHDWLFTARQCINDGSNDPRYQNMREVTFEDSAEILGEAIRALIVARQVQRNDLAGNTITAAVGSSIARQNWAARGACVGLQLRPEHVAAAEAAVKGSSKTASQSSRAPLGPALPTPAPARIVARLTF